MKASVYFHWCIKFKPVWFIASALRHDGKTTTVIIEACCTNCAEIEMSQHGLTMTYIRRM